LFIESDSDSDEDEDKCDIIEVCKCIKEGCDATVKVNTEALLLVEGHGLHSYQPSLKMNVDKDLGIIDGYVFCKEQGNLNS
jgi:hypothetical protein